jgi:hypothetical protein
MNIREHLLAGQAIPACQLALDENRYLMSCTCVYKD